MILKLKVDGDVWDDGGINRQLISLGNARTIRVFLEEDRVWILSRVKIIRTKGEVHRRFRLRGIEERPACGEVKTVVRRRPGTVSICV